MTHRTEKLSIWTKLGYAIGDLGTSAGPGTIIPFWYLYFLTNVARLDPALAGLAILVGKIWDAFNDPLMGALSDRTRTRWGRRRPYLLFGAIPFGVTFALLWIVPPIHSQWLLCAYFAVMYMLFDTACTLVACPFAALAPELTLDHDERTSLVTYQMVVSIGAGLLTAILLGSVIFPRYPDSERTAFLVMGAVCGVVFAIPLWITFAATRERPEFQVEAALPVRQGLRFVLGNREWRYVLAMGLLSWMPVDIASALFPFFLIYWIGMPEADANLILGIILASAALFLPLVSWMARRLEKRSAFLIATASWAVIMLAILLVPRGAVVPSYILAALAGMGVASAHLLPTAMSPDVLEVDELRSGRRQEGIYAGFSVFIRKLSTGLVLALVGPILSWSGYSAAAEAQPASALTAIRLMITLLPAALLVAACVVAWSYPLTRARHAEISRELAKRRTRQDMQDFQD